MLLGLLETRCTEVLSYTEFESAAMFVGVIFDEKSAVYETTPPVSVSF